MVVVRLPHGKAVALGVDDPSRPAVVGDVESAIGPQGGAVRTAAQLGYDLDLAARGHPAERLAAHLDHDHGPVGQGDRALGKLQPARQFPAGRGDPVDLHGSAAYFQTEADVR